MHTEREFFTHLYGARLLHQAVLAQIVVRVETIRVLYESSEAPTVAATLSPLAPALLDSGCPPLGNRSMTSRQCCALLVPRLTEGFPGLFIVCARQRQVTLHGGDAREALLLPSKSKTRRVFWW